MYHRVLPHEASPILDDGICVTPELFEENLVFLRQHFDIVSLKDILGEGPRIKNPCVITFDDGWLDTYQVTFPILRRLRIPATVFLPTG
jgi:peptidoglycan/xylan/chitin deacetylase (PgdA/CDA1 family)